LPVLEQVVEDFAETK